MGGHGLDLSCSSQGQMPGCFKHNYVPSGFYKRLGIFWPAKVAIDCQEWLLCEVVSK